MLSQTAFTFSPQEQTLIVDALAIVNRWKSSANRLIIRFDQLYNRLSPEQVAIVRRIILTDPRQLGFRGPFVGLSAPPDNLVLVGGQEFKRIVGGMRRIIAPQYVPHPVLVAFRQLNRALCRECIGCRLLIESGYRSPAYQAVVFLQSLVRHDFDLLETARHVALPGFSEHSRPRRQALDLATPLGSSISGFGPDFAATREYAWLIRQAHRFRFVLSYPPDNPFGITFEPWHWRYNPTLA
ncbi:MAG: D-alanyl-D-alanine carboxypeptidase family protein [Patescibacteria group bacterium]